MFTLDWSVSSFAERLTEEAFLYVLKKTKEHPEDEVIPRDILSFEEYLRFRSIVQWWLYQNDVANLTKKNIMGFLTPDKAGVLEFCGRPWKYLEVDDDTQEAIERDWDPLPTEDMPKMLLSIIDFIQQS